MRFLYRLRVSLLSALSRMSYSGALLFSVILAGDECNWNPVSGISAANISFALKFSAHCHLTHFNPKYLSKTIQDYNIKRDMTFINLNLFINLSICQLINLSIYQFTNLSIYQFINLSIYQFINLSIYQFTNLPIYLFINLSIYLCIYVSMYLCIYVSMYLCIYVSIVLKTYLSTTR